MTASKTITLCLVSLVAVVGFGGWMYMSPQVHTVVVTVPDGERVFGVWCRDEHPELPFVEGGVATVRIPETGLLRARRLDVVHSWHQQHHVDRDGRTVTDVRGMGAMTSSRWPGTLHLWFRGTERDFAFAEAFRTQFCIKHGLER